MAEIKLGTYSASLAVLAQQGVRYGSVIDAGCAEGNFFVQHYVMGLFDGAVAMNIDANAGYADHLARVRDAVGGHFLTAAVADRSGEIEITSSLDPAWSSVRPPGDPYWERLNDAATGTAQVQAVTLDEVAAEFALPPPYLVKLDIQGAEVAALRGAPKVLAKTDVVICEADVDDCHAIDQALTGAGFHLFDLTQINRANGALAWFYPVYVNRTLRARLPRAFWDAAENERMARQQVERRRMILEWHEKVLPQIRASKVREEKA
ncbi:MAG: FkbM family methyltransferase [Alphaproteobacteria bacterium]|nr:FkbM family methyltransferase [Alphaproteobacteria bacterium]